MRLIAVSAFVILLLVAVTSAPLAKNKVSPAAAVETDVMSVAEDEAATTTFDIDNRQLLAEKRRHSHKSTDDEDHNRGHHAQRAETQDKAIRHKRPTDRTPPQQQHGGQDGQGQQEDWRQYVPAAYRKYLPDESSTASHRAHSKSPRSRSHSAHKSLVDEHVAADAAVEAAAAEDQGQVLAEAEDAPPPADVNTVVDEAANVVDDHNNMDVEAEKIAVVSTTSSFTWFLLLIIIVVLSAGGIAVAAYIANKKQSDYAPLPTREIY